eukprot:CAMPEP_0194305156 /NCGR_PEP_ID=MMETSP0171-20130528/2657_1 /TAXON_ID=218684 /ORGANISM="Corethron pennatum, Strain L29A3" /LENGTH=138 /DNA_ID=CAMNT_0039056593 /DNA_START=108 /DNA_END=524 /DNA_ORIENTATION=-
MKRPLENDGGGSQRLPPGGGAVRRSSSDAEAPSPVSCPAPAGTPPLPMGPEPPPRSRPGRISIMDMSGVGGPAGRGALLAASPGRRSSPRIRIGAAYQVLDLPSPPSASGSFRPTANGSAGDGPALIHEPWREPDAAA